MFRSSGRRRGSKEEIAGASRQIASDGSTAAPTDLSGSHVGRRAKGQAAAHQSESDSDVDVPKGSVFFRCFGGRPATKISGIAYRSSGGICGAAPTRRSSFSEAERMNVQVNQDEADDDDDDFHSAEGDDADGAIFAEAVVYCAANDGYSSAAAADAAATHVTTHVERPVLAAAAAPGPLCECKHPAHSTPDATLPLVTPECIARGSYEEMLLLAKSFVGYWVTITERSDSLDDQYRCLGLGTFKRSVMNRIAVPMTMFLENKDTVLHNWIHTPLGIRHMCTNLHGLESEDNDPDAGVWRGTAEVVDWVIPTFCSRPVRAIRQTRWSDKIGKSIETRAIIPDDAEGRICFYNFAMEPKGKDVRFEANRILKWVSPPSANPE